MLLLPLALLLAPQVGPAQTARAGNQNDAGGITDNPCLQLGLAISARPLDEDPVYAGVARDWLQVSSFTVETFHKFNFVRFGPGPNDYDFSVADELIDTMRSFGYGRQGMVFHTLFWHNRFQLDPWVDTLGFQGTRDVIAQHIDAVHEHYFNGPNAYPINRVDLLNESMGDGNKRLRPPGPSDVHNPWAQAGTQSLGWVDWAEYAYATAQATFPESTKLFYNDYFIGTGPIDDNPNRSYDPSGSTHLSKTDAVYKLVRDHLQPAGLDGVGIQTHLVLSNPYSVNALRHTIRKYAELGVEVHITELDIAIDTGGAEPTPSELAAQAAMYEDVLRVCAEEPNCTQVTIWGVMDSYSWIPTFAPHCSGCRAPLPFDDFGMPKPAYYAINDVLDEVRRACPR